MASVNWTTVGLLVLSNAVMACAWYGPIARLSARPLWQLILVSWLIAGVEYCLAVPANKMGRTTMSFEQLKITQEAISLLVFIPFSLVVLRQSVSWNYAAAMLCIFGAVYFIFRG